MRGGSNPFLAFVLGATVVVLLGLVWYVASDGDPLDRRTEITIELPNL